MKEFILRSGSYESFTGVSFNDAYLEKLIRIDEVLRAFGPKKITYIQLQEELERLYEYNRNDIRSFCALLKKLDLASYDDNTAFYANMFLPVNAIVLSKISRCLLALNDNNTREELSQIKYKLENIKQVIIATGLMAAYSKPELADNNLWLLMRLIKKLKTFKWEDYLFVLSQKDKNGIVDIDTCVKFIIANRSMIHSAKYLKEDKSLLATTSYTYMRSLLLSTGYISKQEDKWYKVNPSSMLYDLIND